MWSRGSGSVSNTSRPAPPNALVSRAFIKATSSTSLGRDVLIRKAPGFIKAIECASTNPSVVSVCGIWIVSASDWRNSSSFETYLTSKGWVRFGVRFGLQAMTSIPKPWPIFATGVPMLPSPRTPRVLPARPVPTPNCQPPLLNNWYSAGNPRNNARINSHVTSTVVWCKASVVQTVTPSSSVATRSIDLALRIPVARIRRKLGRDSKTCLENSVRSRMRMTASKSPNRLINSSSYNTWSLKDTTLRSGTTDQSTNLWATDW